MKILVISAFYPPYHLGGYEIRIKNIMDGLSCRGHEILVLTNNPENKKPALDEAANVRIIRRLHDPRRANFFPKEFFFDLLDTNLLENQVKKFKPDIIYLGHTYFLSKTLLPYLASRDIPILYDEGGIGLIEAWSEHGRWFRFTGDYRSRYAILNAIKPAVIGAVCRVSRGRLRREWAWPENMLIIFNSELNRQNALSKGVPVINSSVIHSGIDTEKFSFKPRTRLNIPLEIIVPGRIERCKGQLDAVQLLADLTKSGLDARLTLAGARWMDGYFDEISSEINKADLWGKIIILPMLTPNQLVGLYHNAEICFFPSYQIAGFSRVPLEAMACGCTVITYGFEGSIEIIRDFQNGFIIPPGDFAKAVDIIKKMIDQPALFENIRLYARKEIEENFAIDNYIEKIEDRLVSIAGISAIRT